MTINIQTIDERATLVCVQGEMTIYQAARRKSQLLAALAGGLPVEIDLSGVDEIDTSGVQLLVLARREAGRHGNALSITRASPAVADALERYGLADAFGIADPGRAAGPLQGVPHEP